MSKLKKVFACFSLYVFVVYAIWLWWYTNVAIKANKKADRELHRAIKRLEGLR